MKKLLFLLVVIFALDLAADEIIVKAADRDRILKLQDGRQVKLKAGMDLIRSDDGKLYARVPQKEPIKAQIKEKPVEKSAATSENQPRFRWFVGAQGISASSKKEYTFKTDKVDEIDYIVFKPTGERFKADGNEHTFKVTKSESAIGGSLGLKDTQNENRYYFTYESNDELSEFFGAVEFGFGSLKFLGSAVPFLKLTAGAGFVDGIGSFEVDSFAYGAGAGVAYGYGDFEFFGGADLMSRNWGNIPARSTKTGTNETVSYGTEERKDSQTKIYLGVRYLF